MIDEEATHKAYGYYSYEFKQYSRKEVIAICNDCSKARKTSKNHYCTLCKSCARKGKKRTEKQKANISIGLLGRQLTEDHKANISASTKGEKSPHWLGGISFAPYCIKFNNEYKEYVRNLFSKKCFLCGKTTEVNCRALCVHHVNYNKNCGCDDTKCLCVPLCMCCHAKTNFDRDFWQALITEMLQPVEAWM